MIAATDRAAIRAAIAARIAAAFPAALDASARAAPVAAQRLPAFAVRSERIAAQGVTMGGGLRRYSDRVTVSLWAEGGDGLRAELDAAAESIVDAILAAPADLGGLAFDLAPAGVDVALEDGERRIGRADIAVDIDYFG